MTCVAQMFKCYVEYYNQCSVRRRPHCPARPHQSRLTRSFFLELATNLCELSHSPKCRIRFLMLEVLAGAFNKDRALLGAFSGHCETSRTFVGSSISFTSSSCGSGSEIIIYLAVSDSRILAKCYFWYSLIKFMFNRAGNFVLKIFSKFLHLDIDEP